MQSTRSFSVPAMMLALLCSFFWGANSLAIKFSVDHLPPIGTAGLRFLMGLLITVVWARVNTVSLRMTRSEWPLVAINAAILVAQVAMLNYGTEKTEAARSTVLITTHVVFVVLLAPLVAGGERLTAKRLVGLAVCLCGLFTMFGDQLVGWRKQIMVGDAIVLASSLLLGLRIAYAKRSIETIHPVRLLFWQALIAVVVFLPFSIVVEGIDAYDWQPSAIIGLMYQGLVISGFCFIAWMSLLKRYDAGSLSVFAFTSPLFGVAISLALRPWERPTLSLLSATLLVAIGICLVAGKRAAAREPDPRRSR